MFFKPKYFCLVLLVLPVVTVSGCRGFSLNIPAVAQGAATALISPRTPVQPTTKTEDGVFFSLLGVVSTGAGWDSYVNPERHCDEIDDQEKCEKDRKNLGAFGMIAGTAFIGLSIYLFIEDYNEEKAKQKDSVSFGIVPEEINNKISFRQDIGYRIFF